MNARERVGLAIRHREADRIPTGEITIDDAVIRAVLGIDRVEFPERVEFVEHLGIDAVCESPEWPASPRTLPNPTEVRWRDLETWTTRTDRFVFAILDGVFGWGTRLMGVERFLADSLRRSEELIDLIREVETLNIDLASRVAAAGADGILIADDIAYKQGTTINPKDLKDLFFPSLERQLSGMADSQIAVFFHSDGNLNAVMDDLVEVGFQGLQCLESGAGMDLAYLKAVYGERICFWGNLDPEDLFLERSPEALRNRVQTMIDVAAPGGGFIFGTSSGLVKGMRPENIEAVYHAVRP
jgi:uroporphyrinogen decarboxylase